MSLELCCLRWGNSHGVRLNEGGNSHGARLHEGGSSYGVRLHEGGGGMSEDHSGRNQKVYGGVWMDAAPMNDVLYIK